MLRTVLLVTVVLSTSSVSAEVYRWVDTNGKVHFSDKKPQHEQAKPVDINVTNTYQNIELKPLGPSSSKSSKRRNRVVMYSAEWCGYCKMARNYFQSKKIPFTEYDIDKNTQAKQKYDKLGGKGVPLILVGKKKMSGFSQQRFDSLYYKKK